jgi:S-formylglutathione hydrolase FrmB
MVGDHHSTNCSIEEDEPPLRVDTPTLPLPERTKVHFAPSPLETMQPTFTNSTGIQDQQRCRAQRKR